MASTEEDFLDIPADKLSVKSGFAMDIGGTMMKVAYATHDGDIVRGRFKAYPRDRPQDAIKLLKEHCKDSIGKGLTVCTCGNGFMKHKETMDKELGIVIDNKNELACFADAYRFLAKNLKFEQIVHPPSPTVLAYTQKQIGDFIQLFVKIKVNDPDANLDSFTKESEKKPDDKEASQEEAKAEKAAETSGDKSDAVEDASASTGNGHFPVLLCILGSAVACIKVLEDGSYTFVDMSTRCGRMFLGLGQLLTGVESYDELLSLASQGDQETLNLVGRHVKTDRADEVYSNTPEDLALYSFGRVNRGNRDAVSREDKTAALMTTLCHDLAQFCLTSAMVTGTGRIAMCGGFAGSPLVREEIGKAIGVRCVMNSSGSQYECHFLKHSSYFGALGALLRTLQGEAENTKL